MVAPFSPSPFPLCPPSVPLYLRAASQAHRLRDYSLTRVSLQLASAALGVDLLDLGVFPAALLPLDPS